ncbi:MAG: CBS domain-containing protein [Nitrospira sp. NTP1]|nr:CBS domain-containing protein [Nitrospira sp. NTP1]
MTKTGSMLRDKPTQTTTPMVAHMMTPGVVQIPGDVSVSEAASLLDREQMPCLLVKDGEAAFGIMTSGDIVKKVVALGLEPHDVEVRSIMSKPVHSVECDQILDDATSVMASTGTHCDDPATQPCRRLDRESHAAAAWDEYRAVVHASRHGFELLAARHHPYQQL